MFVATPAANGQITAPASRLSEKSPLVGYTPLLAAHTAGRSSAQPQRLRAQPQGPAATGSAATGPTACSRSAPGEHVDRQRPSARNSPAPVGPADRQRARRPSTRRPAARHAPISGCRRQGLQETADASSARRISAAINGQTERSRLKCRRHRAGCPGRASWLPVYCGNSSSKSPSMTYAARRDRKFGPDTGRSRHSGRSYRADRSANCLSQGRVRVGFRAELT